MTTAGVSVVVVMEDRNLNLPVKLLAEAVATTKVSILVVTEDRNLNLPVKPHKEVVVTANKIAPDPQIVVFQKVEGEVVVEMEAKTQSLRREVAQKRHEDKATNTRARKLQSLHVEAAITKKNIAPDPLKGVEENLPGEIAGMIVMLRKAVDNQKELNRGSPGDSNPIQTQAIELNQLQKSTTT